MAAVVVEDRSGIAIVRIDRPPVNALDLDTLDEIADALDRAAEDDTKAVVLTGTGSTFSAGADLTAVFAATDEQLDAGIDALTRLFRTLFQFLKPVVAAVNGHALAGGAVLACGCDHRIMGENAGRIGAVEHAAGVPFPAWALELVRHGVNNDHFEEIVLFGRAYKPADGLKNGLVDEVVPDDQVLDKALERAERLASIPGRTYAITKRSSRAERSAAAEALTRYDDEVKAAWRSDEVKAAIKRRLDSLGG